MEQQDKAKQKRLQNWAFAPSGRAMLLAQWTGWIRENRRKVDEALHGLTHSAAMARSVADRDPDDALASEIAGTLEGAREFVKLALNYVRSAYDLADEGTLLACAAEAPSLSEESAVDLVDELLRRVEGKLVEMPGGTVSGLRRARRVLADLEEGRDIQETEE